MPCYHPLTAYQQEDGQIVFTENKHVQRTLTLPCGQCIGCRLERSRQWAIRCMHEASLHDENCYLTLTYNDESLPENNSLDYRHFQLFMKKVRKHFSPTKVRFYMCGEYGEENLRPHFHALLFGINFSDRVRIGMRNGHVLYRSELLEKLWPNGHSSIGSVSFESAAYVARYCMKKVTGQRAKYHYEMVDFGTGELIQRVPEFNRMSLKPGIGGEWYKQFKSDVYPHGKVVVNGQESLPPRYYDKKFREENPEQAEGLEYSREKAARERFADNTDARLAVKEKVTAAAVVQLKRSL